MSAETELIKAALKARVESGTIVRMSEGTDGLEVHIVAPNFGLGALAKIEGEVTSALEPLVFEGRLSMSLNFTISSGWTPAS